MANLSVKEPALSKTKLPEVSVLMVKSAPVTCHIEAAVAKRLMAPALVISNKV